MAKEKKTIRKKKTKLGFTKGVAHIHASSNNTIISISDTDVKFIAGLLPVMLVIPVHVRVLHSLLKWQLKELLKLA